MPPAEELHAERLAVFQHAAAELRFFKTQHWTAVTYTVALLSGMLAIGRTDGLEAMRREFATLAVFVVVGYLLFFGSLVNAERKERKRLDDVRELLPELWRLHGNGKIANLRGRNFLSILLGVVPLMTGWVVIRALW